MATALPKVIEERLESFKKAKGKSWQKELITLLESQIEPDPKTALKMLAKHDRRKGKPSGEQADRMATAAVARSRKR